MRATAADGTAIAYRAWGRRDGEPLLLLGDVGMDARGWLLQRGTLGRRHRLLAVDNRGVGGSDRPPGPYDLEVMAADALAVLDHAGYGSAHVMGLGMGGVLAQILAVQHPAKVRSLVLVATACHHHQWRRELLAGWAEQARDFGMRELVRRNLRWLVGQRSLQRLWPALGVLAPLALSVRADALEAQLRALLRMDDSLRGALAAVRAPTLVVSGSQDVVTTQGDGEELVALIPGAELAVLRGAAHLLHLERAATFDRVVGEFLGRVTSDPLRRGGTVSPRRGAPPRAPGAPASAPSPARSRRSAR